MLAMWAPANMFTPTVSAITLSMKRTIGYFYEHTWVLVVVLILCAVAIAVVETLRG